jgi:hypothetical protein
MIPRTIMAPLRDGVVVAEIDSNKGVTDDVDIVLYDSFAQSESDHEEIAVLRAELTYLSPIPSVRHPHHLSQDRRGQSNPGGAMGVKHGFTPDHNRIDHWRGGP